MTLLELLFAMSIMVIVAGTLGAVASGVRQAFQYTEGHGLATQHARVVLDRIARTVRQATANEQFPGVIVLADVEDSWRFPDTLVMWRPDGAPADPEGLPRFDELVIYCPHPQVPSQLVEITAPLDSRTVPAVGNEASWIAEIDAIKTAPSSQIDTLTGLVRTCPLGQSEGDPLRAAVRFETRLRPSASEWEDYDGGAGSLAWDELSWPQGIYGSQTGLRQVWLRTELQLVPGEPAPSEDAADGKAIPYFGSAALYYQMHK